MRLMLACSMLMLCGCHYLYGARIRVREGEESFAILANCDQRNTYPSLPLEGVAVYSRFEEEERFLRSPDATRYDGSAEVCALVPASVRIRLVKPGYQVVEYEIRKLPRISGKKGIPKELVVVMKRNEQE